MEQWVGLIGVLVGACLAIGQQVLFRRRDRLESDRDAIRTFCAEFIAECEDLRNRIWEEREGIATGRVIEWNVGAHRRAFAQLELRVKDGDLRSALSQLRAAGIVLDRSWRQATSAGPDLDEAWQAYRDSIVRFTSKARTALM